MKLEDKVDISILNDVYGKLLTTHQREMVRLYYDCDISLFEISEQFGISRQAVRDSLVRAEKSLVSYEEKLGIVKKNKEITNMLNKISDMITDANVKSEVLKVIDKVEE